MQANTSWEGRISQVMESTLNMYRDGRDCLIEQAFMQIFGSPMMQAFLGQGASRGETPRPHPGASPEQYKMNEERFAEIQKRVGEGGLLAAVLRCWRILCRSDSSRAHFREKAAYCKSCYQC